MSVILLDGRGLFWVLKCSNSFGKVESYGPIFAYSFVSFPDEPLLLIADEPTTALDVTVQAQILQLLDELKTRMNMAMLFITHDFGVVADIADDVIVMFRGEIVETGTKKEVLTKPKHPYTKALLACVPDAEGKKQLKPIDYAWLKDKAA